MNDILSAIYGNALVQAVSGLIFANVVVGIAVSLYTREFRLGMVADWLMTRALPYLLGAGTVQLVLLTVPPAWSGLSQAASTTVWLFVCGALVGKILAALKEIGLPAPEILTDQKKAGTPANTPGREHQLQTQPH